MVKKKRVIQNKTVIRVIFFDLDDTLYSYKSSNSKIMAEIKTVEYFCKKYRKIKLNQAFEDFTKAKQNIKERFPDLPHRGNRGYWITEFLQNQGKYNKNLAQEMENIFWKTSCENVEGYYDAKILLEYLKNKGYKLGVITNGIRKWQIKRLKATGFKKYFDFIATTTDAGYEKPHVEVFKYALKQASVKPEEAVMIGDNPVRDIVPANKIGMTTVWLRRGKRYYLPVVGKEKANYIIKNFLELINLF